MPKKLLPLFLLPLFLIFTACSTDTANTQVSKPIPRMEATGHGDAGAKSVAPVVWNHQGSQDFESRYPGLGISRRFQSEIGWADLYEYDGGNKFWTDGIEDPLFKGLYEGVVSEILGASEKNGARGTLVKQEVVTIDGMPLQHTVFQVAIGGKPTESHLYLTIQYGQIVKFRISLTTADTERTSIAMRELVSSQIKRLAAEKKEEFGDQQGKQLTLTAVVDPNQADATYAAVWLAYALFRIEHLTKRNVVLRKPEAIVPPSFEEELYGLSQALIVYKELKEKDPTLKDDFWETLENFQKAGYLEAYAWLTERQLFWAPKLQPQNTAAFQAWISKQYPTFKSLHRAAVGITSKE